MNGTFANPAPSRFPSQLAALGEILAGVDPGVYGSVGNQTVNAGCFVEYLTTVGGLRAQWFDKLESSPKGCGRVGWDTPAHLRGVWFHRLVVGAARERVEYESPARHGWNRTSPMPGGARARRAAWGWAPPRGIFRPQVTASAAPIPRPVSGNEGPRVAHRQQKATASAVGAARVVRDRDCFSGVEQRCVLAAPEP